MVHCAAASALLVVIRVFYLLGWGRYHAERSQDTAKLIVAFSSSVCGLLMGVTSRSGGIDMLYYLLIIKGSGPNAHKWRTIGFMT